MTSDASSRTPQAAGIGYAAGAYLLWGTLPLYFLTLVPTGPWEIVAWRIFFSLAFCVILLSAARGWRRFLALLRQPRILGWTALAGLFIYANWQIYLIGTLSGHVVETALGYFINPIVTVLLGVIVLRERLRPLQWVAIGIAALAVLVIVIGYGSFPWIALSLAASFGLYGLIKKQVGPRVDAVSGLTLETLWLTPVAAAQLLIVSGATGISFGQHGAGHVVLLLTTGIVTALPLLLFAAATRRIGLASIGMMQFIAPIMQFLTGVFLLGEEMPVERWVGFALVWVAVLVFVVDLVRAGRRVP